MAIAERDSPYAIAMWDFSWLERRYEGGGYADWDRALDELVERGYDAVRIDPYPHLVAAEPRGTFRLPAAFSASQWGNPETCEVQVMPALVQFIGKCADRDVSVALSSWFRVDATQARQDIETPADHVAVWTETLSYLDAADLLETVCWVDLCNEFPLAAWAPFFEPDEDDAARDRSLSEAIDWVNEGIAGVREEYPQLSYTVSESAGPGAPWGRDPAAAMDFIELHCWLLNTTDFYPWALAGHDIDSEGYYEWLAETGEPKYREDPQGWQDKLSEQITLATDWSKRTGKPLATTEGWGPINFRDDPDLSWDWVKELCAHGTREAAASGRWVAIATSNFCGPQFEGMWSDVEWHQELTEEIRSADIDV